MGGYGSGRWNHHDKRRTVDASIVLDIKQFRIHDLIKPDLQKQGVLQWHRGEKVLASVRFTVDLCVGHQGLRLQYRAAKDDGSWQKDLDYIIPIDELRSYLRPERFYFLCPLHPNNGNLQCMRRCQKLYLPLGAVQFGCRACHNLTYRSCQESHTLDTSLRHFGINTRQARQMGLFGLSPRLSSVSNFPPSTSDRLRTGGSAQGIGF